MRGGKGRAGALLLGAMLVAPAAQAQFVGSPVTGQFQRHRMIVPTPLDEAEDITRHLFRDVNRGVDVYQGWKKQIANEYNLSWSAQVSYFYQAATPDSGQPVSTFVWSPSASWTPFSNSTFGTGQFNVSFSQNQYWSRVNTPYQQGRMGTITAPNDWGPNSYAWSQVAYTQTMPGRLGWLAVTAGQYGIGGFDGDLYAGNAQTNFVSYALAQNATATYPVAGLGGYGAITVPRIPLVLTGGFQGATNISGRTITNYGFETGAYAYFGNALLSPTVPGLGVGSYNLLVYYQPSVPAQVGHSTGYSFAMSQAMGKRWGIFLRANTASGDILAIKSSFAGGVILNNPFGRHGNDQLGFGIFGNRANREVVGPVQATPRLWESGLELYYNYTLFKGLQLTPNFAAFFNPVLAPNRSADYLFTLRTTAFF